MRELIVGSEALAAGLLTRQDLRARYDKVHRNVYALKGPRLTARDRARAAWLWSERRGVLVGSSSAAMLGTKWLPDDEPAELALAGYHSPKGILIRGDQLADDELRSIRGITCTTPARTAYDLGRRIPKDEGIIRVDALLNATRCSVPAVEAVAARYPYARGMRQLRTTLDLVDGGAESPQETRLRLLLVRSIEPRPVTQIPVRDDVGRVRRRIDMGWPQWMVGVEYDGEQHFDNPDDYAADIVRLEFLANRRWTIVRVSARQLRNGRPAIVARVRRALALGGKQ
jgi:very-short-patch-repair endonuclease